MAAITLVLMLAATAEPLPQETAAAGAVWLTREQVESDLGQVTTALTTRFAHFARTTPDYARHVSAIRSSASQGLSRDSFGLALTRLLALFQDSHAVVRGYDFPPGSLPFGIEPLGDRFVAHSRDRADFLAPNHPYLSKIDGRPLDDFLLAATRYVARGSISYRKVQTSAILGRLNLLRADLGLVIRSTADVTVQSDTGSEVTIRADLVHANAPPSVWPETPSAVLESGVVYLRLPAMDAAAAASVETFMPSMAASARGTVIDVRGNYGGSRRALEALLPSLLPGSEPARVVNVACYRAGPTFARDHLAARSLFPKGSHHFGPAAREAIRELQFLPEWVPPEGYCSDWHYMVIERDPRRRIRLPVVVLADRRGFSATDIFLSALKGLPGITLMGTPTSGGSSFTRVVTLSHSRLDLHLGSMLSFQRDGRLYDQRGIEPDVLAENGPDFVLRRGADAVLDLAIRRLLAHKPDTKPLQPGADN